MQSILPTSANGMPPPSAITKGCSKSHPRRRRAVPRLRFDMDDVRFELRGSKVRFADIHVSHLSRKSMGVPGTLGRAGKSKVPGCFIRHVGLSDRVAALD